MAANSRYLVFPDLEALSQEAARLFAQAAQRSVQAQGSFVVALAGGSTPAKTYALLAQSPYRESLPWHTMHIFWGDERCVPPNNERSNARMARLAWLDQVPIPPEQIHPVQCLADSELGLESAARGYDTELRRFFQSTGRDAPRFDFVFLGLGEDGHTASLMPNHPVLEERALWAAPVPVDCAVGRISLTLPVLNLAQQVLFLVSGLGKSWAVARVLGPVELNAGEPPLPAALVQPVSGRVEWLLDTPAADALPH